MFTFPFTMMSSADDAYTPAAALMFDGAADTLSRTFSDSDGTEFIFSVWVKRTSFSDNDTIFSAGSSPNRDIYFFVSNQLYINLNDGSDAQLATSGVFRDTAWYHILVSHHHGEGTASDRIKVYVNGVEPSLTTTNYPSSSTYVGKFNENQVHYLGSNHGSGSENWFSGYMADPLFIDTKSIQEGDFAITDFGGFSADTGIWMPKDVSTLSYSGNSFYLDLSNGADIGNDVSGRNNDFTPSSMDASNIAGGDNPANSPDKEITIYPVIDPVGPFGIAENTLSNNNLTWVSGSSANKWNFSTIPISNTDKVYMEFVQAGNCDGSNAPGFSIATKAHPGGDKYPGQVDNDWGLYLGIGGSTNNAQISHDRTTLGSPGIILNNQPGGADGDVYMMARHGDSLWFGRNNTWYNSGNPAGPTNPQFHSSVHPLPTDEPLYVGFHSYGSSVTLTWRPYSSQWSYSPPSGFGEMKSTVTGIGNYATLNPIASSTRKGGLSNGNLTASGNGKDNFSTMNIPLTGKWYFEATLTATGSDKDAVGVAEAKSDQTSAYSSTITALYGKDGTKFTSNAWSSYGDPITAGETVGVYINAGQVTFYLDGDDSQGTCGSAFTTQCFATTQNSHANTIWNLNFGQKPFIYSLPDADAKALATQNLPEPTHANPDKFMAHGEFTMGTSNHKVSISDFNPSSGCVVELLRIDSSSEWVVGNTVLGAGKHFNVSIQQGEQTDANLIHSYNSDGVTFGTTLTNGGSYYWRVHRIHADYCDVQTRTGTGSAHAESHNLNYKPGFLYCLANASSARGTYHSALGATKAVFLDDCDVPSTSSSYWNNVEPTDSQYTVGTDASTNASSVTYYDIMFTDGAGLCFFGSFTGNGIDDGPMVNMNNSQPKNVMVFRTGSNSSAYFIDYNTVRNPSNVCTRMFLLDNSGNEYSGGLESDILATGWKARDGNNGMNASEQMIISAWGLRRNSRAR